MLKQEVQYCHNEVQILKSEQNTICDVAQAQGTDIEKYLHNEIDILNDVICNQAVRQKAEVSRIQDQIGTVTQIRAELNHSRSKCEKKLMKVVGQLGVQTVDP